jgi:hypothetical protein
MTPLFRRAFGNAADNRVARLKKFYEISAQKKVLPQETGYTKRGREIWEIAPDSAAVFGWARRKMPFVPLCDTVCGATVVADRVSGV